MIIDTCVLDAAFRSPNGASRSILVGILKGTLKAAASTALLLEYESVIKREKHLKAYGITLRQVDIILSALTSRIVPVHIFYKWRPILNDPNDDMVLEAAVNSGMKTIVTFNLKDFKSVDVFGLEVVQPRDIVKRVRQ